MFNGVNYLATLPAASRSEEIVKIRHRRLKKVLISVQILWNSLIGTHSKSIRWQTNAVKVCE